MPFVDTQEKTHGPVYRVAAQLKNHSLSVLLRYCVIGHEDAAPSVCTFMILHIMQKNIEFHVLIIQYFQNFTKYCQVFYFGQS